MKALSVRQPWASLIASGSKKIEYRSWPTGYRGDLLICASKGRDARYPDLPRGVAMCIVTLSDCRAGKAGYEWILKKPRRVPPVPIVGRLKLFDVRWLQK